MLNLFDDYGLSNNRNPRNVLYLPTVESCRDYKVARFPSAYSTTDGAGENIPDFMQGGQFGNSGNKYIKSINEIETSDSPTNSMDEVLIEVLSNQPYVSKMAKRNINGIEHWAETYQAQNEVPEYFLRIAPTWEEITIDKSHKWGQPEGFLSGILDTVNSLVGGLDDLKQSVDSLQENADAQPIRQQDLVSQYQSTDKEQITIPFVLFTKNNFVRDIFYPIMMITALSYSVRIENPNFQKELEEGLGEQINESELSKKDKTNAKGSLTGMTQNIMANYRLNTSMPPRYLRVSHSSGLFYYAHMNIKSFEYSFKTPFYNIVNNSMQKKSFPLMAECSLTLQASDHLLNDHYLQLIGTLTGPGGNSSDIVNVNVNQGGG